MWSRIIARVGRLQGSFLEPTSNDQYLLEEFGYINCGINSDENIKRGRMCTLPKISEKARQSLKSLREQWLQVHGAKRFNKLPWELRNLKNCDVAIFKEHLDKFLSQIPDNPVIGDLVLIPCDQMTSKPSNSLQEWIPQLFRRPQET